jgi:hypothetical protein
VRCEDEGPDRQRPQDRLVGLQGGGCGSVGFTVVLRVT